MEKQAETSTVSTTKGGKAPAEEQEQPKRLIVGIPGSLRDGSYAKRALQIALDSCDEHTQTSLLDLEMLRRLPFRDGLDFQSQNYFKFKEDIDAFRDIIRKADGLIVSTPEYHNSFSGSFFSPPLLFSVIFHSRFFGFRLFLSFVPPLLFSDIFHSCFFRVFLFFRALFLLTKFRSSKERFRLANWRRI